MQRLDNLPKLSAIKSCSGNLFSTGKSLINLFSEVLQQVSRNISDELDSRKIIGECLTICLVSAQCELFQMGTLLDDLFGVSTMRTVPNENPIRHYRTERIN